MKVVDPSSFLVIVAVAALAGVLRTAAERRLIVPVVVLELLLGVVIGPQVADIATPGRVVTFFSSIGLAMLFFFAGYEPGSDPDDRRRTLPDPAARARSGRPARRLLCAKAGASCATTGAAS